MQVKEFNYRRKKISYRTKGQGPLVVLLHGFAEDGTIWKNQYDIFPNHQLVIPDLPGSGGSELIDDMSIEGMADVIHDLLLTSSKGGTANTQPSPVEESAQNTTASKGGLLSNGHFPLGGLRGHGFTLIGHSMGGYIALAFAEKHPDALNALGLFHSTAFADTAEKKETRRKGIAVMKEKGGFEFLKTAIPATYAAETKENNQQLPEEHLASARNFSTEALVMYYEAMMRRPDRTSVLKSTSAPVLFVAGKYDAAVPMEDSLKLCHLPQLSYIHVLRHSGHMGMLEEPNESNKILVEFVTTVEKLAYT